MPHPFRLTPISSRRRGPDAATRPAEPAPVALTLADGRIVEVRRVRHPQARRIKLCVDERGARLTLPPRASLRAGDRFLAEQRDWLAEQLAHCDGHALAPLQVGVTAALPLRDAMVPLHWQPGRYARLQAEGDALVFSAPAGAGAAALRRALRDFYESQARADLGRWLPRYLPDLPRPPRQVRFKQMSSQWGSLAADGSMALDLALVLGRASAFEYVLVHELCHLVHADHSRAFWREVTARCPGWRAERDWFRAHGRPLKARLRQLLAG